MVNEQKGGARFIRVARLAAQSQQLSKLELDSCAHARFPRGASSRGGTLMSQLHP